MISIQIDMPELNPLTRNQRPAHLINDNEITSNAVINIFQPMLFQPFNELLNVTRHHETNAHKLIIRAHRLIQRVIPQTFPDLRSGAKQGVSSNDDGDCFYKHSHFLVGTPIALRGATYSVNLRSTAHHRLGLAMRKFMALLGFFCLAKRSTTALRLAISSDVSG